MSRYNSSRELAQKMDSEGGLAEFAFGYGLYEEDLPDDMPEDIRSKFANFLQQRSQYDLLQDWLFVRMEDPPGPGDWDYEPAGEDYF